jgi:predicted dehydrogenase
VFQNRRYDSCFLSVRREIARGAIGRVTHFESRLERYRPEVRVRWKEAAGPAGGLWADLGPHLVDQALVLFGKPEAVTGLQARHRDDAVTDDWAHVVLHYPGLEAVLHTTLLGAAAGPRFVLHGTDGSLVKSGHDRQEDQLKAGYAPGSAGFGVDPDPLQWTGAAGERAGRLAEPGDYAQFYRRLRDAILGQDTLPVTLAEALATAEVMDAVRRSVRERRTVSL